MFDLSEQSLARAAVECAAIMRAKASAFDEYFSTAVFDGNLDDFPLPCLNHVVRRLARLARKDENPLTLCFVALCKHWDLSFAREKNTELKAKKLEKLATALFFSAIYYYELTIKKEAKRNKRLSQFLKATQLGIYTPNLNQHFINEQQRELASAT